MAMKMVNHQNCIRSLRMRCSFYNKTFECQGKIQNFMCSICQTFYDLHMNQHALLLRPTRKGRVSGHEYVQVFVCVCVWWVEGG